VKSNGPSLDHRPSIESESIISWVTCRPGFRRVYGRVKPFHKRFPASVRLCLPPLRFNMNVLKVREQESQNGIGDDFIFNSVQGLHATLKRGRSSLLLLVFLLPDRLLW
jgi:hypothetical protein